MTVLVACRNTWEILTRSDVVYSHTFSAETQGHARLLCAISALGALLLASPARAQQPERSGISFAYERTRDRFHYRFENPSSFDTPELVPHEFTQTYWGDNQWLVVRGA